MTAVAKKHRVLVLFVVLAVLATARLLTPLVRQSATYDEPFKIGASYVMAKEGYFYYDPTNPPLYKYLFALPLLALEPDIPRPDDRQRGSTPGYFASEFVFGYRFLFNNTVPAQKLLVSTRFVSLAFYLIGGLFFFWYLRRRLSVHAALTGSVLYFLCPNLAAAGVLATNDIFVAVFTIFFLAAMLEWYERPTYALTAVTGILLGAAASVKFSLFILAVFYGVAASFLVLRKRQPLERVLIKSLIVFGAAVFILELTYQFMSPASIVSMIRFIYGMVSGGLAAYAAGNYSTEGFAYFYPLAFLLKTPLPVTVLLVYAAFLFFARKKYRDDRSAILAICLAIFIFASLRVKLNLGLRYILPVYPLAYLFAATVLNDRPAFLRTALPVLAGLLIASNILVHPHYQSYFNLLIGKNENAYNYLVDSSLDWGQDLGELSEYLKKEGGPEVTLAYFGSSNPVSYGIRYQDLCSDGLDQAGDETRFKHINSDNPRREYLAVSATCRVGLDYPDHGRFSFLDDYRPRAVIGNTIFVYDITGKTDIYKRMALIYADTNALPPFLRCGRTVAALNPADAFGRLCLAASRVYNKDKAAGPLAFDWAAIEKSPDRNLMERAAVIYVTLLVKEKQYSEALRHLSVLESLRFEGLQYKVNNLLGLVHMRQGEYAQAREQFNRCVTENPRYAPGYYNLGLLCEKMNDFGGAANRYREALMINPRYIPARMRLKGLEQQAPPDDL